MRACRACASRGLLLASLAAHLDRGVDRRTGGRAKDVLALDDESLVAAMAPDDGADRLRRAQSDDAHEDGSRPGLVGSGCWSTCAHRDGFPASLAALEAGAPKALFVAGDAHVLERLQAQERSVTVVGSRRAGAYGRDVAHELSRLLASSWNHRDQRSRSRGRLRCARGRAGGSRGDGCDSRDRRGAVVPALAAPPLRADSGRRAWCFRSFRPPRRRFAGCSRRAIV